MRKIALSLWMIMLVVSVASADYSARESFKYTVGDTIDDAITAPHCGWGGSWKFDAGHTWGAGCSAIVGDSALVYDDMLYPVPNFGSHLTVYTPGGWSGAIAYERSLDKTWPNVAGTVYWTSHIFDVEWRAWTAAPTTCSNYSIMERIPVNFSPLEKAAGPVHILVAVAGRVPVVLTFRR
jgi:hypothetical protein